jgi:uncharacterized membrane-anchored protein YitT (DUF2179 family)
MVKCVCIFTVIYEEQFLRALSEVLFYFYSFIIVAVALLTGSVSCPGMYCNNDLEETGILNFKIILYHFHSIISLSIV